MNKTYIPRNDNLKQAKWYLIDANNETLGRLSTLVASMLKGKHQQHYTPYLINKNYIIIINSENILVTGRKKDQKTYTRHSGQPGGLKIEKFKDLKKRIPNRIIEHAVKGMLPKGSLGKQLFRQIKIYPNNIHPHLAQKPSTIKVN